MPQPTRQLSTIMFTDVVGYTALMGEDEEGTNHNDFVNSEVVPN